MSNGFNKTVALPPHTSRLSISWLKGHFGEKVIGKMCYLKWVLRSLDLNHLEFFVGTPKRISLSKHTTKYRSFKSEIGHQADQTRSSCECHAKIQEEGTGLRQPAGRQFRTQSEVAYTFELKSKIEPSSNPVLKKTKTFLMYQSVFTKKSNTT